MGGGDEMKKVGQDIQNRQEINKQAGAGDNININVQKRDDV